KRGKCRAELVRCWQEVSLPVQGAGLHASGAYLMRFPMPGVFELHGDEVGRGHSVADLDSVQGLVQCFCWLQRRGPQSANSLLDILCKQPLRAASAETQGPIQRNSC